MKNNTALLYGVGGLVIGVLLATCFSYSFGVRSGLDSYGTSYQNSMMHQMPDGTMMGGDEQMSMSVMMDGMMMGLHGKTGDAFDQSFLSEMIVHHEGAVVMAQAVLKSSKRPELINLANDIISAQTGEIAMMKQWQKTWFVK